MTPAEIAAELTSIYRTPNGTMSLRPLQGQCVLAGSYGGLWTNASVGLGKSLILAMLMSMIGGERPMILTEASSIPGMSADFERFRLHFQLPTYYRLESFETLSNNDHAKLLEEHRPTFLGIDECHKVKYGKPRWKRIERWRELCPGRPMACVSGTPGREMTVFAHTMLWAIPALARANGGPIPVPGTAEFREFCKRLREDETFHQFTWDRIKSTPGVVISAETYTDTPLRIKHTILPTPPEMEPHWTQLREKGEAPDGWILDSGIGEQWGLARCFSSNMFYEHDPRPAPEYTAARKGWFGMCNTLIEMGDDAPGGPYDTPGQVAKAVLAGTLPSERYSAWMRVKDTYNPAPTRTKWLSRAALEYAAAWGRERAPLATKRSGGSIIWTEHTGFGVELARMTGWPFYGDGARCSRTKGHISLADRPGTPPVIICSTKSCGTGKNLQHRFSRGLFMNPPSNNADCEQWFGRTHRSEQSEPIVEIELLYGCMEDWGAFQKAYYEAQQAEEDLTAPRKILLAQHDRTSYPDLSTVGLAWKKPGPVVVQVE